MPIKLFIVDDHYMVIEGIRSLLQPEQGIEWMGHATSAAACLAFLRQNQPDVIFMDINLPDQSGTDLCREVLQRYPAISIVGLSTFNQYSYITRMMDNGALGYVLKNATRSELVQAIENAARGRRYLSHEAALTIRKDATSEVPVLTRREREVLELVAAGLTSNEIAEKLFVSITTINTHRKSLLAKFELNNTAAMIRAAIDHKLIDGNTIA